MAYKERNAKLGEKEGRERNCISLGLFLSTGFDWYSPTLLTRNRGREKTHILRDPKGEVIRHFHPSKGRTRERERKRERAVVVSRFLFPFRQLLLIEPSHKYKTCHAREGGGEAVWLERQALPSRARLVHTTSSLSPPLRVGRSVRRPATRAYHTVRGLTARRAKVVNLGLFSQQQLSFFLLKREKS